MSNRPPQRDPQSRNEYIPSFISKKPFYIDESTSDADYLEHQRLQSAPKDTLDRAKWYERGKKLGPAATKFRKGACENCGSMTHKTKECLSRPRKLGARWTGKDIQADEVVEDVKLGWDAKRDRWNGYDPREYDAVVNEYEELEALKRAAKGEQSAIRTDNGEMEATSGTATPQEEARYGEETDMGRSQPTSTRQLRLREDTAKYLLDLNLDSAKYDPKTRSMDMSTIELKSHADSGGSTADAGFVRPASDAEAFERAQRYAWETQERAVGPKKLHLQANPTEGEILVKKSAQEATVKRESQRKALLDKYGDASTSTPANVKRVVQPVTSSERYVEYDESGGIRGAIKQAARSKYAEDVYTNNHTSVWGSWWRDFQWGYACCHSTVKNSYCTGEAGKTAFEEAEKRRTGDEFTELPSGHNDNEDRDRDHTSDQQRGRRSGAGRTDNERDRDEKDDDEKTTTTTTLHKRTLHEMQQGVTEEELETYKRTRAAADDPMAKLLGKDELLA